MRQLSRQLVQAQEEERRSIARELHDEVGQMLTGLRMELKSLQRLQSSPKELFDARLDKTKSLIEKTVRSVRGLAMGLRPSMLDDLGLRPALEWQSREFERLYEIPVALTLSESIDFLPEDHRITIYRIIQEALTNCARHAQAKNIDVEVLDKQGTIQITIADDGVGFTRYSRTGPGLGLLGIQERVHHLGGLFEVKPREGGGTVLVAEIPSEDMVMGMPEARILVADDHSIVRKGLRSILEDEASFEIVGEASNGREAVKLCEAEQPDVAILDVGMPQLNGIEVVVHLQKVSPRTKALMLSMHCDETYILRALNAGARGYLLKDTAEDEVVPAIRNLMRGASYFSPAIRHAFRKSIYDICANGDCRILMTQLTDREREVLQLLAEGRSNKEVASMLDVGVSTVDTHRMNLMQKLNLHSTAEIVLYAVRKKLIT